MKSIVSVVVGLSLVASMPAIAGKKDGNAEPKQPKAAHAEPKQPKVATPLLDLTFTGRITKAQKQTKDGKTVDSYTLTTVGGPIMALPIPRAQKAKKGEGAAPAINLDNYTDKMVTVTAKVSETEKDGVKKTKIKEIVSVVETPPVEAAPAAQ